MNIKLLFVAIIFFILGCTLTYFLNRPQETKTVNVTKAESLKPLGFITGVKFTQGTVYLLINQDYISFNPYETAINNNKHITLKKEDYPKLFKQGGADSSIFKAEHYVDPKTEEAVIKLSNSQPDHGGYASTYVLLVNPFTGEINEGESDYAREKLMK